LHRDSNRGWCGRVGGTVHHEITKLIRSNHRLQYKYVGDLVENSVGHLNKISAKLAAQSKLRLITDHSALRWLWTSKPSNSRLFRRSILLNPLKDNVEIVHRPGKTHMNVDPLWDEPNTHKNFPHHPPRQMAVWA
jgi:hypothetical protein